jgi:enoyl-CoA hydratase/carnithine racemase
LVYGNLFTDLLLIEFNLLSREKKVKGENMTYEDLLFDKKDGIGTITLNVPEKLNALTAAMRDSLIKVLDEIRADDDVKVCILTGAGRGFCSGASMSYLTEQTGGSKSLRQPLALWEFEKPIIAAINGIAAGGGLAYALYCDIRIAAESARFAAIWVKRGLFAGDRATYFLPRLIGVEKALELLYTGDIIDAKEAERIGLVSRVVPDNELMKAATELARKIAQGPPISIKLIKSAFSRDITKDLPAKMDFESYANFICQQTEDNKEGIRAFLEKRPPQFKGR